MNVNIGGNRVSVQVQSSGLGRASRVIQGGLLALLEQEAASVAAVAAQGAVSVAAVGARESDALDAITEQEALSVSQVEDAAAGVVAALGTNVVTRGTIWEGHQELWTDPTGYVFYDIPRSGQTRSSGDGRSRSLTVKRTTVLPNGAQGQNNNGGFTCTGLDRIGPTGALAGCWVVGNDGRQSTSSGTFNCSIVILSPDFRSIVREFSCNTGMFPGIESIQGVAWDSSDDTIWFVDKTNKKLRHIDMNGVGTGVRRDASKLNDEIAFPNPSWPPNALSYVPEIDALLAPSEGGTTNTAYVLSCVDGSQIRTLSMMGALDHTCVRNGLVYYTYGANASDGGMQVADFTTGAIIATFDGIRYSQAIEGVWIDTDGSRAFFTNDGAFHDTAKPPLALAIEADLVLAYTAPITSTQPTRVKAFANTDASASNLGYLNPEPRIVLPDETGLVAYFRTKQDLGWSLNNLGGALDGTVSGAGYTLAAQYMDTTATGYPYVPGLYVTAPGTILSVFWQTTSSTARLLGGTGRNSGSVPLAGMIHSGASNNYLGTVRRADGTTTTTSAIVPSGGDRWEMLAVTFDNVGNTLKLRRPRTTTEVSTACTNWPAVATDLRIGGGGIGTYNGDVRIALCLAFNRILTSSEIDAIYAAAATSLTPSGIVIT